jgi:hypothetical protein
VHFREEKCRSHIFRIETNSLVSANRSLASGILLSAFFKEFESKKADFFHLDGYPLPRQSAGQGLGFTSGFCIG